MGVRDLQHSIYICVHQDNQKGIRANDGMGHRKRLLSSLMLLFSRQGVWGGEEEAEAKKLKGEFSDGGWGEEGEDRLLSPGEGGVI